MLTVMQQRLNQLAQDIISDYDIHFSNSEVREEFVDSIHCRFGKKYIKVVVRNSVWGFIVNTDDDAKFAKGDILKAAGWSAPARNKARGNILTGGYQIHWTGPYYLKG